MRPIEFPCTTCEAVAGEKCQSRDENNFRTLLPYYHADRVDTAIERLETRLRARGAATTSRLESSVNERLGAVDTTLRRVCTELERVAARVDSYRRTP